MKEILEEYGLAMVFLLLGGGLFAGWIVLIREISI